jgi:hypothetical protein
MNRETKCTEMEKCTEKILLKKIVHTYNKEIKEKTQKTKSDIEHMPAGY